MSINVLQYESKSWDTANLLLGAGIKQSDFPKFMMPFFALIMLESRLVRYAAELEQELSKNDMDAFIEEFQDYDIGYNDLVIRHGITLKAICQTDDEGTVELREFTVTTFDAAAYYNLLAYYENELSPLVKRPDYKEKPLRARTATATYHYDADQDTLMEETAAGRTALGCGRIEVKAAYKKGPAKKAAHIIITAELTPDYQKDYEVIAYDPDPARNQQQIDAFLARYVTRPFRLLDNVVGVEINFNKVFYKPEALRPVANIMAELAVLETALRALEKELI